MKGDSWLMCRFGGIGDSVILTIVAKAILEKCPEDKVDFAVRSKEQVDLFKNLPIFNKVFEIRRFPHPHFGANCVKNKDGWELLDRRKKQYNIVMDYVNSIENNSLNHSLVPSYGEWVASQNSNFVNWIDLSLGWANIDPEKVKDKRPEYKIEDKEREKAKELIKGIPRPIFGINLFASSRARSYFNPDFVIRDILEEFDGCSILHWDNEKWILHRKGGSKIFLQNNGIRNDIALIKEMDVYVGADSGFSHLSEAVGTKTVSIYTTVPAWTRCKYYKYTFPIDIQLDCKPCFTLQYQCPINRKRAFESLSDRERQILQSSQTMPLQEASIHFSTTPDKLSQELQSINARCDAIASVIPDCIASVSSNMIIEKVKEALNTEIN